MAAATEVELTVQGNLRVVRILGNMNDLMKALSFLEGRATYDKWLREIDVQNAGAFEFIGHPKLPKIQVEVNGMTVQAELMKSQVTSGQMVLRIRSTPPWDEFVILKSAAQLQEVQSKLISCDFNDAYAYGDYLGAIDNLIP
jgi:hypothetical protein